MLQGLEMAFVVPPYCYLILVWSKQLNFIQGGVNMNLYMYPIHFSLGVICSVAGLILGAIVIKKSFKEMGNKNDTKN